MWDGSALALPPDARRARPRDYTEWKALRRWGRLPPWEQEPVGYVLRLWREEAQLTQKALADLLGCSQQAVAQAERWDSNPTMRFIRRWACACGRQARLESREV